MIKTQIFPIDEAFPGTWDSILGRHPEQATMFHTREWMATLQDTFGYKPMCVLDVNYEHGSFYAALPFMVDTRYGINNYFSMPFDTYGGIIGNPKCSVRLVDAFLNLPGIGMRYFVDYHGLFPSQEIAVDKTVVETELLNIGHERSLDYLWKRMNHQNRAAIKATEKNTVCRLAKSQDDFEIVRTLFLPEQKTHGGGLSPEFTMAILKNMVPANLCLPYLTFFNDVPVCASLIFQYGKLAMYWAMSLNEQGRKTHAHFQLVWTVIRDLKIDRKVTILNFGATPAETNTVSPWKKSWGTTTYRYPVYRKIPTALRPILLIKEVLHG